MNIKFYKKIGPLLKSIRYTERIICSNNLTHSCDQILSTKESWIELYKGLINKIDESGYDSLDDKFIPVRNKKLRSEIDRGKYFADYVTLTMSAGSGGDGAISLSSTKENEFAGPDGGDGGNGAHIIFKSTNVVKGLNHVQKIYRGINGESGHTKDRNGKAAKNLNIEVPLGTVIKFENKPVASLNEEGHLYLAARGGAGGKGNSYFKSSIMTTPYIAEYGGKGEEFQYSLELRIMADIGLIGFPNAGKSTLLRAISRARPKVASYPFTTVNPHIGMVHFSDDHQMPVADIPGLISGAHLNLGLGISFLRHIERCSCLLYVLDGSEEDPLKQLEILKVELEMYKKGLSERPHAIVLNKMDMEIGKINFQVLKKKLSIPIIPISAKMGENLVPLLAVMRILSETKFETGDD